ncbi:MAG: dockerin type I repeat-containing protein [Clostridia bacterium]|nr:dockerin type I repeat-containing protein [Clostridia bacterium]
MKLYKKLFAVLMSAALVLCLAFSGVSAEAVRTLPEVPDGYDGYVVVDFEVFVMGWGYIIEPTLVPFHEGETLADVTVRLLETAGVGGDYSNSQYGFYLAGVECQQLIDGMEIVVPDYLAPELEDNFGCYNDDGDGWYNPENGDGILSQSEYTYYSGWMNVAGNVAPDVGADGVTVEDGVVYRWMYSIYGWGMDVGISDGWGMFPAFDNPSYLLDRDAATALYAEIAADPELSAMVEEGGQAHDEYVAFVETITDLDSDQAAVDAALAALEAALYGGVTPGDVDEDGSVSISDALTILRHAMGLELLEGSVLETADVDGNSTVNTYDALLALRIALDLI